ncbi:Fe2+-dependent dioxygenase [Rhizosaccharibacter radicis]|uniref:Fe2+-dependent dioxygenase n=1 Tax=Rhizosaccharibacter radicis TaxID=2782605 RepID=A0ABT1VW51_9PROT|nr:Fe2+-dependent dioxygenase [Acetobacteraceae bacterium KSS12]
MLNEVEILSAAEAADLRARLLERPWTDGRATAGHQSARAKQNLQLDAADPVGLEQGEALIRRLGQSAAFVSAALPHRIFPPLWARYRPGDRFDTHVDNAVRYGHGGAIRTDLSATLFLTPEDEYEGGALVIEDSFGPRRVRLPAGRMVLYPSSSLHHVEPVTQGERVCAVLWLQSLVRDDGQRTLLLDLDNSIRSLGAGLPPDDRRIVALTGTYHNLVRRWAEL